MKRLFALMAMLALVFAGVAPAQADVVYNWHTVSATVGGASVDPATAASGQIILTDAGYASSNPFVLTIPGVGQTLKGIEWASLRLFEGPVLATSTSDVVNFNGTVNGSYLDIDPANDLVQGILGFFVNAIDTDAYYGEAGPGLHQLTVYGGTDNANSPCYGSQLPGESLCQVTGYFERQMTVPEPSSLALLAISLIGFGLIWRGRAT